MKQSSVDRTGAKTPVVPAVAHTLRILDYLGHHVQEARVSDIARALEINKSTCFNILATLLSAQIVDKHPIYATYRLGPKLVDLGNAARRNISKEIGLKDKMRDLVDEIGLTCVVSQVLADGSGMVIVDRAVPPRGDVMTLSIGHVVSMKGPAMARAVLAMRDETEAIETATRVGLIKRGGEAEFTKQLETIRSVGYATSVGERDPNVNAVAAAAGGQYGTELVLCVVGYVRHFSKARVPNVGARLAEIAAAMRSGDGWTEARAS